jgi:hypothetical protein
LSSSLVTAYCMVTVPSKFSTILGYEARKGNFAAAWWLESTWTFSDGVEATRTFLANVLDGWQASACSGVRGQISSSSSTHFCPYGVLLDHLSLFTSLVRLEWERMALFLCLTIIRKRWLSW